MIFRTVLSRPVFRKIAPIPIKNQFCLITAQTLAYGTSHDTEPVSTALMIFRKILNFQIEFCFHKSENGKFRQLGKCQRIDRCKLFNYDATLGPFMSRIISFLKYAGIADSIPQCPMHGREEYKDMALNPHIMSFLPKGILKISVKNINDKNEPFFGISIVFLNN
jgi:hypothetical protein